MFALSQTDLGRPIQDLRISYQPVEIRSYIDQVYAERLPILLRDVEWRSPTGEPRWLDVHIVPLLDGSAIIGAAIAFADVSSAKRLQRELEHANQELETAYEELQSTNEELETTNEELQSTNEELETTNEELQSTNEELETMNEELQSSNEELETVNEELRQRTEEVDRTNSFLGSILASLRAGVIVLDRILKVAVWNRRAEDLWGLRSEEVLGQPFLGLDMGLPTEKLARPIRSVLSGTGTPEPVVIDAVNRRGRKFHCQVRFASLTGPDRERQGVILLLDEE